MSKWNAGQTGGDRKQWSFDPTNVPEPIAQKLTYIEQFEGDEPDYETMLAIVMDRMLADLPEEFEEAVRLLYLAGMSQHKAAEIIGVTHKTVKARAQKGLDILRKRLTDSVWLADMLQGLAPTDSQKPLVSPDRIASVIESLGHHRGK
jgi:predicted DNA-binding protein (UPF0251 family)